MTPVTATGRVCALVAVRMSAKRNSFQEKMKTKIAVTTNPGAARGSAMRRNAENQEQPSTSALSSSSRGISLKNPRSSHVAKGRFIVEYAITRLAQLSSKPSIRIRMKMGMMAATGGGMRGGGNPNRHTFPGGNESPAER